MAVVGRRATLILAAGLLVVAIMYLAFAWFGGWNHQNAGHTMLYWAAIVYTQTAVFVAAITLSVFIILFMVWTWDKLRERPTSRVSGWEMLLSLAALFIASAAAAPTVLVQLTHIDSARLGEHVYQLAFRMALDGDNQYFLYECDGLGLVCTSRALSEYSTEDRLAGDLMEYDARIAPDLTTNTIIVEINGKTTYIYRLSP